MKPRIIDEDEYRTSHAMPVVTYRATGGMHSMCGPAPALHVLVRIFDLPHDVSDEDDDGWVLIAAPWGADDDEDGNPADLVGMARTLGYRVEIY